MKSVSTKILTIKLEREIKVSINEVKIEFSSVLKR